jgi:N-glycosylase/DNA lyase
MRKIEISEDENYALKQIFATFDKPKTEEEVFYVLCFCICVSQTSQHSTSIVVDMLKNLYFFNLSFEECMLMPLLKGRTFSPKNKVKRLLSAKKDFDLVLRILEMDRHPQELRDLLVKFIKGLGMKTASHFLRNLGYRDLVIIDNSTLKFLKCEGPTSDKKYKKIEKNFKKIAEANHVTSAKLDALVRLRDNWTMWR